MNPFDINYSNQIQQGLGAARRSGGSRTRSTGARRGGAATAAVAMAQQGGVPRSEILTQKLYDTAFIQSGVTEYRMFAIQVGGRFPVFVGGVAGERPKQKTDTNLLTANKLETGQRLIVSAISVKLDITDAPLAVAPAVDPTPEDVLQIFGKGLLEISIAQVIRFSEPLDEIPTGLDIYSSEVASRGVPSPKNVRDLRNNPLDIPAGQSFEAKIIFDAATTPDEIDLINGLRVKLYLDGDFKRAVS